MIGAERDFLPLPTTVIASSAPTGASARRIDSASEMRRSRAVEERQHGGVARQHPGFARLAFARRGRGHGPGVGRAQRPGQAARGLRSAKGAERRGRSPAFARDVAGERPQGRERALERSAVDALRPPAGEKGAKVAGGAIGEIGDSRRRAESLAEKGEKLPQVAAVSLDRTLRQSPLAGEMDEPGVRDRGEVGRGGERGASFRF